MIANSAQKPFCTFYIVRHGQTEWNTKKLLQGKTDSPLTEEGLSQAKEAAELFKQYQFATILSSDLLRAKRTAEIIALEHKITVTASELLRERSFGEYEGQHVEIFRSKLREAIKDLTDTERRALKLVPDMESDDEVIARFFTYLRSTALSYPDQNVLVVTHSGIIRILLLHLGYMTEEETQNVTIKNLAYVKIDCDGNEFFIRDTHNIFKG